MKKKNNITGLALSAGVGIVTGLIYFLGKLDGRCEAFTEVANEFEKLAKEAAKTEN
jgi:hypothetical protein